MGLQGRQDDEPKSMSAGIMVSDFVDERTGFLAFSDEEYSKVTNLTLTFHRTLVCVWSTVKLGKGTRHLIGL